MAIVLNQVLDCLIMSYVFTTGHTKQCELYRILNSVNNTENFTDAVLCDVCVCHLRTCIGGFCTAEVALSALASVLFESL